MKKAGLFSLLLCLFFTVGVHSDSENNPTIYLSEHDHGRLESIIQSVKDSPSSLTPVIRREFWAILDKGDTSAQAVQTLHMQYSLLNLYKCALWRDILNSYKTSHVVKSREREVYEQEIEESFSSSADKYIKSSNLIVAKSAEHKPAVNVDGVPVNLNETGIKLVLSDFVDTQQALDVLFTRPGTKQVTHINSMTEDATEHYNKGLDYARSGQLDKAILGLKQSIKIAPGFSLAYDDLGTVLLMQGDKKNAIRQYQFAIHLNPRFALAHYNYGLALQDTGHTSEALREWQKVLTMGDPQSTQLAQAALKKYH